MKIIKYTTCTKINKGTVKDPIWENLLSEVLLDWNEKNEQIAKKEAYNGEYVVEDDGQPDPSEIPTKLDIIEAQVTYTAMMTDTLLEV
jgi:hypothetical protein